MSFNKMQLIGHVGREPKKLTDTLATFTVATKYFDGATKENKTEWFDVLVFNNDAKYVLSSISTGDLVYVEGPLVSRTYTNKEGAEVKAWEVKARYFEKLKSKNSSATEFSGEVNESSFQVNLTESNKANRGAATLNAAQTLLEREDQGIN